MDVASIYQWSLKYGTKCHDGVNFDDIKNAAVRENIISDNNLNEINALKRIYDVNFDYFSYEKVNKPFATKRILSSEGYFRHLELEELKLAFKSARTATVLSLGAIIAAVFVPIILAIFVPISLSNSNLQTIKDSIQYDRHYKLDVEQLLELKESIEANPPVDINQVSLEALQHSIANNQPVKLEASQFLAILAAIQNLNSSPVSKPVVQPDHTKETKGDRAGDTQAEHGL